jgi:hypothetical protein
MDGLVGSCVDECEDLVYEMLSQKECENRKTLSKKSHLRKPNDYARKFGGKRQMTNDLHNWILQSRKLKVHSTYFTLESCSLLFSYIFFATRKPSLDEDFI